MVPEEMKKLLCKLLGHRHGELVVDCQRRKAFHPCARCGDEFQYDFEREIDPRWIGFAHGENQCPLCLGWKSKDWLRCGKQFCIMNLGLGEIQS